MSVMILVRGIPGSGKTTFAEWYAQYQLRSKLMAADDYFVNRKGHYDFNASRLPIAHEECQQLALQAMVVGKTPIIHNTFTKLSEMRPYIEMAKDQGYGLQICDVFDGDQDDITLTERNVHEVPGDTIHRMRLRYSSMDEVIPYVEDKGFKFRGGEPVRYMKYPLVGIYQFTTVG